MDIKGLSNNIRRIRVLRGLTQENVANDLGISLVAYGKIEQGKTDISYSRLSQIADCLQIDIAIFFQEIDVPNTVCDSQNYQIKNQDIRRLEKELTEVKTDIKLIKTYLFEPSKKM
ncbi:MAG: helix-turn-helix transcriptional regulator [Bacteroidales bacterium]|jgi:transcriptional regulator with XRE-family HTH domain|nr:helix-turn-helix transcriptional regulator [Bacteroidales bacterium]